MRARSVFISVFILVIVAAAASAAGEPAWRRAQISANRLYSQNQKAEAEAALRAALPDAERAGHAPTALIWNDIGSLHLAEGRCEEASTGYQRSLRSWEKVTQGHEPEKLRTAVNLAVAFLECGKPSAADKVRRQFIDPNLQWLEPGSRQYARYLATAADIAYHRRRHREAEALLRKAMETLESGDKTDPQFGLTLNNLAVVEIAMGKRAAAEEHANRAFEILKSFLPRDHVMTVKTYNNQATIQYMLGHRDEAARLLAEALELCQGLNLSDVIRLRLMENYRIVLRDQKRKEEERRVSAAIKAIRSTMPTNHTVDVSELSAFR